MCQSQPPTHKKSKRNKKRRNVRLPQHLRPSQALPRVPTQLPFTKKTRDPLPPQELKQHRNRRIPSHNIRQSTKTIPQTPRVLQKARQQNMQGPPHKIKDNPQDHHQGTHQHRAHRRSQLLQQRKTSHGSNQAFHARKVGRRRRWGHSKFRLAHQPRLPRIPPPCRTTRRRPSRSTSDHNHQHTHQDKRLSIQSTTMQRRVQASRLISNKRHPRPIPSLPHHQRRSNSTIHRVRHPKRCFKKHRTHTLHRIRPRFTRHKPRLLSLSHQQHRSRQVQQFNKA